MGRYRIPGPPPPPPLPALFGIIPPMPVVRPLKFAALITIPEVEAVTTACGGTADCIGLERGAAETKNLAQQF